MVMLDGSGVPRALLGTIELIQSRLSEIDETFAFDEGEGDRTLEYWRMAHRRCFERHGTFARTCFFTASCSACSNELNRLNRHDSQARRFEFKQCGDLQPLPFEAMGRETFLLCDDVANEHNGTVPAYLTFLTT
jgi:hypothetical protein